MNCRRARNLLFDFFDGLSNESLRAEVERHLGECADCEKFAAEMTRSLALLRQAPVEPLDENFNWKVRLAIHRERNAALSRARSAGAWVKMWNLRYTLSSALAFSAVLVAGAIVLRSGPGSAPVQTPDTSMQVREEAKPVSTVTGPSRPARPTTGGVAPFNHDNSHLVSTGQGGTTRPATPATGAIDMTGAEARIDSLIKSDVMRMSARDRELYIQRRIELLQRHRQSQQPAPAP